MRSIRPLFVFLILFGVAIRIGAQEEEDPTVDLRFLFLDEKLGEGYSVEVNDDFQKVGSYPYAISSPVSVPPRARLNVYKDLSRPEEAPPPARGEEPDSHRVKIATVTAPENTEAVLVVLRPSPGSQLYQMAYYNSDPRAFPEGTVRVINLGREPIGVALGGEVKRFAPGDSGVLRPKPDHKHRVITKVMVQNGNGWKNLYDSLIVMESDDRVTGIVLYSPGGMRHTLTALEIAEFGEPEPRHAWRMYKD